MKKYLKLIPLILYPYAYLILLISMSIFQNTFRNATATENFSVALIGVFTVYHIYVLFIAVYNSAAMAKKRYSAYEAAKMNLAVKCWQIPAYIFHYLLGLAGLFMSIWGIGIILFVLVIDLLTIALTGIHSIGCTIRMKKDGILSPRTAFFTGVGSFIYCADIVIAIVYVSLCRRHDASLTNQTQK